jgi:hypothetical protein
MDIIKEYFDEKQIKLINAWHSLSAKSEDIYMSFMAEWIAFNAICYNLYYKKADIERANIDRSKSKLNKINELLNQKTEITAEKIKINFKSEKLEIDLLLPDRLFISISKNYTEDIIFSEFVKDYGKWYEENPYEKYFDFMESLKKKDRYFVINMSKINQFDEDINIDEMAKKNIIILCEKNNLSTIKNVLYQIRCNIFHGEKIPGDINDDRIVKAALPLLRYLVNFLIEKYEIKKNQTI